MLSVQFGCYLYRILSSHGMFGYTRHKSSPCHAKNHASGEAPHSLHALDAACNSSSIAISSRSAEFQKLLSKTLSAHNDDHQETSSFVEKHQVPTVRVILVSSIGRPASLAQICRRLPESGVPPLLRITLRYSSLHWDIPSNSGHQVNPLKSVDRTAT